MVTLNKEDFTEEQWEAIMADIDRERLRASETARKNARKEFEREFDERLREALEEERRKLEMSEAEKIEAERQKLEEFKRELEAERKRFQASKKLLAAGFPEESVEKLVTLFEGVKSEALDEALDTFIATNQSLIEQKVTSVKQELLNEVTPPQVPGTGAPAPEVLVEKALEGGDGASAIEVLLASKS